MPLNVGFGGFFWHFGEGHPPLARRMLSESGAESREEATTFHFPVGSLPGLWALGEAGDACPPHPGFSSPWHPWDTRKTKLFSTFPLALQCAGGLQLGKYGPCFGEIRNTRSPFLSSRGGCGRPVRREGRELPGGKPVRAGVSRLAGRLSRVLGEAAGREHGVGGGRQPLCQAWEPWGWGAWGRSHPASSRPCGSRRRPHLAFLGLLGERRPREPALRKACVGRWERAKTQPLALWESLEELGFREAQSLVVPARF